MLTADQTVQAARAQAIRKLQARYDQIKARIETMYLDKLDGRITQEFFDRQSETWAGNSRWLSKNPAPFEPGKL